jgi:hypothetical protein
MARKSEESKVAFRANLESNRLTLERAVLRSTAIQTQACVSIEHLTP